jgi:hypothetical protein
MALDSKGVSFMKRDGRESTGAIQGGRPSSGSGAIAPDTVLEAVALPLFIGSAIYILCRPTTLKVFDWLSSFGLADTVAHVRKIARPMRLWLPHFVVFNLPAALMTFSFIAWIRIVWRGQRCRARLFWLTVALCIGPLSEFSQRAGLLRGTFDLGDLALYFLAGALAFRIPSLKE